VNRASEHTYEHTYEQGYEQGYEQYPREKVRLNSKLLTKENKKTIDFYLFFLKNIKKKKRQYE